MVQSKLKQKMKYLKKSADVLIGKAGGQSLSNIDLADYTAMLTMITSYRDGSGEEVSGINLTREHLEQMRNAIDDYLSRTDDNAPISGISLKSNISEEEAARFISAVKQVTKQLQNRSQNKQTQLVINPRLIIVNELRSLESQTVWSAKLPLPFTLKDFTVIDKKLALFAEGSSEEEVRAKLNTGFNDLIMACVDPDSSESRIPDVVQENQQPVNSAQDTRIKPLRLDLGVWQLGAFLSQRSRRPESEAIDQLHKELILFQDHLFADLDSSESRIPDIVHENQQPVNSTQGTGIKPLLRVDLSKATSKKTEEGWEARITYWDGCNIELTAFGCTEPEAKAELYKELAIKLQNQLVSLFSAANEPENTKETNESDDKDATQFKLNPNRVMSMKIGVDKWEARTKVFKGINDAGLDDLVATGVSEEEAREELDKKFSDFAGPMTNFIKFMSQAS